MKIAILGYAGQGQTAYEYWNVHDNEITICDSNPEIATPTGVRTKLGSDYLTDLSGFDMLVRTPALHPKDIAEANSDNPDILKKVTTVTNEFFKVCPTKNIIGVTGTKGKGTTSTLIAKILEAAGKRVHLGGNIGIPPLELLKNKIQPEDWVVLELANFQLIDLQHSPHIAVCLMVVPEHLNWHGHMEEYTGAKHQLFAHQTIDDIAVYNRNNAHSAEIASGSAAGTYISYEVPGPGAEPHELTGSYVKDDIIYMEDTPVGHANDVVLLGRHNLENVCAAIATTWSITDGDKNAIHEVITAFQGLPHRLELTREVNGVRYYNDSLGTTPETAVVAIQAFEEPKVMILGGADKGVEFDELAHVISASNVRAAIVIGEMADKLEHSLAAAGFENIIRGGDTMKEIVTTAAAQAKSGDVVLLSTGCASFGMFKNYQDRGDQFKDAVNQL